MQSKRTKIINKIPKKGDKCKRNNNNLKLDNMSKERDVLDIWKERIKNEARHGDKKKACEAAGTTATTFLTAMKRERFIDLKDGELRTLQMLIERLNDRKERFEKIQSQYAG